MPTAHNSELISRATDPQASSARDFGDPRAEFQALISGCGVFDLSSRAKIRLTGEDRVRWLNGMVTNNVRDLAPDHGVYAFLLNPQGRILGDLYAYNRGASLLVDTAQSQLAKVLEIFDRYIIMDDVEVSDVSAKLTAAGVTGTGSRAVMKAAGIEVPVLRPLEVRDLTWREIPITLVRGEDEKREAYEIWLAPEHAGKLREALRAYGAAPVGTAALELYRIARGIPRYGQDIRERDLPQETEQMRALNFTKGCYVGQEIVERIRSRGAVHRTFAGFLIDGPLPAPGTKIQAEDKDVGEITSAASLPLADGDRAVALGYIRREVAESGKSLQAGEAKATVVATPFAGV